MLRSFTPPQNHLQLAHHTTCAQLLPRAAQHPPHECSVHVQKCFSALVQRCCLYRDTGLQSKKCQALAGMNKNGNLNSPAITCYRAR